MSKTIDIAVIGAGPYGLSLAAHLRYRGIEFRIFGEPMESWKNNMPKDMLLKSMPWASSLSNAGNLGFTIDKYFTEQGIEYHDTRIPIPAATFIGYGEEFQRRLVPSLERKKAVALSSDGSIFSIRFDDDEIVYARRVVVAVGIIPFSYMPPVAGDLPDELVSHSSHYGPLDDLDGKAVVVVGSGSSATDLAAFMHERGIDTTLVMRGHKLPFADLPPADRKLSQRIVAPDSGIGYGWMLTTCASAPWLINRMPEDIRVKLASTRALGPLGGAFMKDRVIGKVRMLVGQSISQIERRHDRLHLRLINNSKTDILLNADHVIFATGYRIDIDRLGFIDRDIRQKIRLVQNAPRLSHHYETTVPGLHFIGPASMQSFGPVPRFVFGTPHPARHLARYLAQERITDVPEVPEFPRERVAAGNHNRG